MDLAVYTPSVFRLGQAKLGLKSVPLMLESMEETFENT